MNKLLVLLLEKLLEAFKGKPVAAPNSVVVGYATCFGLDYDTGKRDPEDNGLGAWGAHTANKDVIGVSLPEKVYLRTFGIEGDWSSGARSVGKFLSESKIQVAVSKDGKTVLADVVDAGPAAWAVAKNHVVIDLTYALAHQLDTKGKAIVSYSIIKDGKPMEIKGWDFVHGKVL